MGILVILNLNWPKVPAIDREGQQNQASRSKLVGSEGVVKALLAGTSSLSTKILEQRVFG
jgi:hypothetical protein